MVSMEFFIDIILLANWIGHILSRNCFL